MLSMSSPLDPFKTMKPYLGRKTILAYSWLSHFAALVTLKNALGGRGSDWSTTARRLWMPGGRWSTVVRWHRYWVTVCVKCCVAMDTVGFRRVWQRGDAKKKRTFQPRQWLLWHIPSYLKFRKRRNFRRRKNSYFPLKTFRTEFNFVTSGWSDPLVPERWRVRCRWAWKKIWYGI